MDLTQLEEERGLNFRFSDSILLKASEHNEHFPDKDWTGTSIRRKFAQLHKVKIPTGDPTCPAEVRYAKKEVFRKEMKEQMLVVKLILQTLG